MFYTVYKFANYCPTELEERLSVLRSEIESLEGRAKSAEKEGMYVYIR